MLLGHADAGAVGRLGVVFLPETLLELAEVVVGADVRRLLRDELLEPVQRLTRRIALQVFLSDGEPGERVAGVVFEKAEQGLEPIHRGRNTTPW